MKNVYSIVLSADVVEKIDRLAYENGTNRSNMINQILAEYVSYTTPEKRFREVFRQMQTLLEGEALKTMTASDTMFSLRSALAYKYNPTVKYNVELYRNGGDEIGEFRVSLRTQNAGLILYMVQFYELWARCEALFYAQLPWGLEDGKYRRKLILSGAKPYQEIDLGRVIAAYIHAFDRALKAYFARLHAPEEAAAVVGDIYRAYLKENRILI